MLVGVKEHNLLVVPFMLHFALILSESSKLQHQFFKHWLNIATIFKRFTLLEYPKLSSNQNQLLKVLDSEIRFEAIYQHFATDSLLFQTEALKFLYSGRKA